MSAPSSPPSSVPLVRRLRPADGEAYLSLRREMLQDAPFAFLAAPQDDICLDPEHVRRMLTPDSGNALFGAFAPHLIGTVGMIGERHVKASHKATIWGMYVAPSHRRRGIGSDLLRAAIAHARTSPRLRFLHLGVSATTPGARALYEQLGFSVWGTEPGAVHIDGVFADEHYMVLRLRDAERGP